MRAGPWARPAPSRATPARALFPWVPPFDPEPRVLLLFALGRAVCRGDEFRRPLLWPRASCTSLLRLGEGAGGLRKTGKPYLQPCGRRGARRLSWFSQQSSLRALRPLVALGAFGSCPGEPLAEAPKLESEVKRWVHPSRGLGREQVEELSKSQEQAGALGVLRGAGQCFAPASAGRCKGSSELDAQLGCLQGAEEHGRGTGFCEPGRVRGLRSGQGGCSPGVLKAPKSESKGWRWVHPSRDLDR